MKVLSLPGWATNPTDCWLNVARDVASNGHDWEHHTWQPMQEPDEPVVLVGWSLGALLALDAAIRFPGKVAGMVLVSATARFTAAGDHPGAAPRVLKRMRDKIESNLDDVLANFAEICFSGVPGASQWLETASNDYTTEELTAGLDLLAELDLRHQLGGIPLPALVIHGKDDKIIPVAAGQSLATAIPRGRIELVSKGGHALPYSHGKLVTNLILGFMNEHFPVK